MLYQSTAFNGADLSMVSLKMLHGSLLCRLLDRCVNGHRKIPDYLVKANKKTIYRSALWVSFLAKRRVKEKNNNCIIRHLLVSSPSMKGMGS